MSTPGILTNSEITELLRAGAVRSSVPLDPSQVQPTSLDLRLGGVAHKMRAAFLPRSAAVAERLADLRLADVDLAGGAVLEKGGIYLVPLQESLDLPRDLAARCNPKSSTGRIDLFTRVITDRHDRFDDVAAGYEGPLYLELMPRSFPVRVRAGLSLNQARFWRGASVLSDAEHLAEHGAHRLVTDAAGEAPAGGVRVDHGFHLGVRLVAEGGDDVIGYRARRDGGVLDLGRIGSHDPAAWFTPIRAGDGRLLLEPEEFYIFASRERIRVPPHLAAEMVPYDVGIGELRTHYAGFFDAGFGYGRRGERRGTPAVLEVRPHDVPFLVEDGQVLFRLEFSRLSSPATRLYGEAGAGSHYADQGVTLAKFFRGVAPRRAAGRAGS